MLYATEGGASGAAWDSNLDTALWGNRNSDGLKVPGKFVHSCLFRVKLSTKQHHERENIISPDRVKFCVHMGPRRFAKFYCYQASI